MENQNQINAQTALPNATAVLVLGIISIVGCFCYGLVGIICGIVALVLAKKDIQLYKNNPGIYTDASLSTTKSGRVCAIIGLCISSVYIIVILFLIILYGSAILSHPWTWHHAYNTY